MSEKPTFTINEEQPEQPVGATGKPKRSPQWWRYVIVVIPSLILVQLTGWFLGMAFLFLFFPLFWVDKSARLILQIIFRGIGILFLAVALYYILPYLSAYSRCGGTPYYGSVFAASYTYNRGMATIFSGSGNKYYCTPNEARAAGYRLGLGEPDPEKDSLNENEDAPAY